MENPVIEQLNNTLMYLNKSDDTHFSNKTVEEIINIIKETISQIRGNKNYNKNEIQILFAPTGDIQEIAIKNNWCEKYLEIANEMDKLGEK